MSVSYVGDKTKDQAGPQVVMRLSDEGSTVLDPKESQRLFNHSPDGFQWGYGGSGPAQLALAILYDVTGDGELSVRLHQDFKNDKIVQLDDRFILIDREIREWLSRKLNIG